MSRTRGDDLMPSRTIPAFSRTFKFVDNGREYFKRAVETPIESDDRAELELIMAFRAAERVAYLKAHPNRMDESAIVEEWIENSEPWDLRRPIDADYKATVVVED